jgi:predicted membrane protein
MTVTRIAADTGGGNVEVILPDSVADLNVIAKTGAGNVTVHIPHGVAARIHATSGLGKAIIDPQFSKTDQNTYQSPDFDSAFNRVEITIQSGAGNVSVNTK